MHIVQIYCSWRSVLTDRLCEKESVLGELLVGDVLDLLIEERLGDFTVPVVAMQMALSSEA